MFKKGIRGPIWALFFLSLGGLLLHIKIHPPAEEAEYYIPVVVGLITTLILPFMFNYEKTVRWAFLINVIVIIVGTVTMAHYSFEHWGKETPVTLLNVIYAGPKTTFPDIVILFAKLPLGLAILSRFHTKGQPID